MRLHRYQRIPHGSPHRLFQTITNTLFVIVLFVCPNGGTVTSSLHSGGVMTNVFEGNFQVFRNVSKLTDVSSCTAKKTFYSWLRCVDLCAGDAWCAAVFAEFVDADNSLDGRDFCMCYLCSSTVDVSSLHPGAGRYGIAKYPLRGLSIFQPEGATFQGVQQIRGQLAAKFTCGAGIPNNDIYLDTSVTPTSISTACQNTMCLKESVKNVPLRVVQVPATDKFYFYPVCPTEQTPHGHAICEGSGVWTEYDVMLQMCLPSTCVKFNTFGRPAYAGHLSTTVGGNTCQGWTATSPHAQPYGTRPHLFLVDNKDPSQAMNYCRALGENYLWCYTTNVVVRWEMCEVPSC